jgi:hypothetical protein
MNSLDGIQPASSGDYFYTRVLARLQRTERNIWEQITALIGRPVVAIPIVLFVILMNALVVLYEKEVPSALVEQSEQSNYDEFNVAANTFYDNETSEP